MPHCFYNCFFEFELNDGDCGGDEIRDEGGVVVF